MAATADRNKDFRLNPLYSDGFSHTDKSNKDVIVHYKYFKGSQVRITQLWCISVPEDCLYLNSVDPDEMTYYAAFNLGLHCLSKFLFRGFQYTKG